MSEFLAAVALAVAIVIIAQRSANRSEPLAPSERHTHVAGTGEHFVFEFVPQRSGEIRIFIIEQPSYGGRDDDGHSTHRYRDSERRYYICIKDNLKPTSVPEAITWATYWADKTAIYIRTGQAFS